MANPCESCGVYPVRAKGKCYGCWKRSRRYGDTALRAGGSLMERLWRNVEVDEDGCWIWHGLRSSNGYAVGKWENRNVRIHRITFVVLGGQEIPTGLHIDHLCRKRPCVNPDHLEAVTRSINSKRVWENRTVCKNGHTYDQSAAVPGTGYRRRICNQCKRETARRRREKLRLQS